MSSASTPGTSQSRGPLVIVLAVIGILAIIAGILYVSGAANSLHFMDGSVHKGHHQIRAIVSFVVGIAFLIGAYIAKSRPAAGSRGSTGSTDSPSGTATPSGT
jgi:formate hydrogenlyase subunit 3/multisubunit Na+/H+ antiporter MnhD subunit